MAKRTNRNRQKLKNLQAKRRRLIQNIDSLLQSNNYKFNAPIQINQSKRNNLLKLVKGKNKDRVKLSDDTQPLKTIYNIYTQAVRELNKTIHKLQDKLSIKRKAEHQYTGDLNNGNVEVTAYHAWDRKQLEDYLFKQNNFLTVNGYSLKKDLHVIYSQLTKIYDEMESNDVIALTINDRHAKVEYVNAKMVEEIDKKEKI